MLTLTLVDLPSHVLGEVLGRGLHSSTYQLNLSQFW